MNMNPEGGMNFGGGTEGITNPATGESLDFTQQAPHNMAVLEGAKSTQPVISENLETVPVVEIVEPLESTWEAPVVTSIEDAGAYMQHTTEYLQKKSVDFAKKSKWSLSVGKILSQFPTGNLQKVGLSLKISGELARAQSADLQPTGSDTDKQKRNKDVSRSARLRASKLQEERYQKYGGTAPARLQASPQGV